MLSVQIAKKSEEINNRPHQWEFCTIFASFDTSVQKKTNKQITATSIFLLLRVVDISISLTNKPTYSVLIFTELAKSKPFLPVSSDAPFDSYWLCSKSLWRNFFEDDKAFTKFFAF